jgi:hypothetical protein
MPGSDQLGGQRVQPGRVQRGELLVRHAKGPLISGQGPHQVVLRRRQAERLRGLAEADRADRHAEAAADHRHPKTGHALYHVGWPDEAPAGPGPNRHRG